VGPQVRLACSGVRVRRNATAFPVFRWLGSCRLAQDRVEIETPRLSARRFKVVVKGRNVLHGTLRLRNKFQSRRAASDWRSLPRAMQWHLIIVGSGSAGTFRSGLRRSPKALRTVLVRRRGNRRANPRTSLTGSKNFLGFQPAFSSGAGPSPSGPSWQANQFGGAGGTGCAFRCAQKASAEVARPGFYEVIGTTTQWLLGATW